MISGLQIYLNACTHGAETVYSIIKHHPFAKAHGSDGIQKADANG